MKQEVIDMCDELVAIAPGNRLSQGIDSLNVSVATGKFSLIYNAVYMACGFDLSDRPKH